jgi:hypothetical protein
LKCTFTFLARWAILAYLKFTPEKVSDSRRIGSSPRWGNLQLEKFIPDPRSN